MKKLKPIFIVLLLSAIIFSTSFLFVGCNNNRPRYQQIGITAIFEANDNPTATEMRATVSRIENLLIRNEFHPDNFSVMRQGSNQIRVSVLGIHDSQEFLAIIGEPAELDFRRSPAETDILFVVDGANHIDRVSIAQPELGEWGVRIHFTNAGGAEFRRAVQAVGENNSLYIFANGRLLFSPVIRDINVGVDNTATFIGPGMSQQCAQNLRTQIESGLFKTPLTLIEVSQIISSQ